MQFHKAINNILVMLGSKHIINLSFKMQNFLQCYAKAIYSSHYKFCMSIPTLVVDFQETTVSPPSPPEPLLWPHYLCRGLSGEIWSAKMGMICAFEELNTLTETGTGESTLLEVKPCCFSEGV